MQQKALSRPALKGQGKKTRTAKPKKPRTGAKAAATKETNPPKLTFRTRTTEDDAYILHLTEEQLGAIHEQAFQEPFPRDQFQRYLQSGAPTFVVERGAKRVGYFSYLVSPNATMHISALVIEPQHQSDGIGTAIMNRLEQEARAQGVLALEVFVQSNNEKSLAFTRKLGFVEAYRVTPTTICFQKRVVPVSPPLPSTAAAPGFVAPGSSPFGQAPYPHA